LQKYLQSFESAVGVAVACGNGTIYLTHRHKGNKMKPSTLFVSLVALSLAACGGHNDQAATDTDAQAAEPVVEVVAGEAALVTPVAENVATAPVTENVATAPVTESDVQKTAGSEAGGASASVADDTVQPTVGDCYKLTAGNEYELTDGSKRVIVSEKFNEIDAFGEATYVNNQLSSTTYRTVTETDVTFIGLAAPTKTTIFKGNILPATMKTGDTTTVEFKVDFTTINTDATPGETKTATLTQGTRFVGVEDLTLHGKTFPGVCKVEVKAPNSRDGSFYMSWYANGFGKIKTIKYDASNNEIAGTTIELLKVVQPEPTKVVQPETEKGLDGMLQPETKKVVQPKTKKGLDGLLQPETTKVAQPKAEKVAKPKAEKVAKPEAEKVAQPETTKVAKPKAEKVAQPEAEKGLDGLQKGLSK
jgi:hypothetical protein